MNREFLKEQGLTDEQIEAVMKEHGKTVNTIKQKADKVDGLESQINDLQTQIQDRDKQLTDLQEKAKDNKELSDEIERLKQENENTANQYKEQLAKQQKEFAIESALRDAQAKNPKAVKALLDTESIKLDGETLLGLEDQLSALKESDAYLFGEDEPTGIKGRKPHIPNDGPKGITRDDLNKMSYKERVEFKQTNPEAYDKLIKGE